MTDLGLSVSFINIDFVFNGNRRIQFAKIRLAPPTICY